MRDWNELRNQVVKTAKSYIGKVEIKGNKGWTDKLFQAKMEAVGWKITHAWCAYFCEMVYAQVYDAVGFRKAIDKLFSGSATKTLKQFEADPEWNTGTIPLPGAVAIWCAVKNGKESWKGHAAIVTEVHDTYMDTVEGNTNGSGSREGEEVAEKKRKYDFEKTNGLRLKGFVYPPGITPVIPFNSKQEGDEFREWVNNNRPEVAKRIDLDRSGSWFNSYIKAAFLEVGHEYLGA